MPISSVNNEDGVVLQSDVQIRKDKTILFHMFPFKTCVTNGKGKEQVMKDSLQQSVIGNRNINIREELETLRQTAVHTS